MVHKCANAACSASFHTLRDGRVFVKEVENDARSSGNGLCRQLRYFWLCGVCCRTLTVIVEKGQAVKIVPLYGPGPSDAAQAAS